jgi:flagellar biosynthesis/type III secretory pathway M-ring protein FliF/YscJ
MAALQGAESAMSGPVLQSPPTSGALPAALAALSAKSQNQQPEPQPDFEEDVVVQLGGSKNKHAAASEDEQRARVIARLTEENPATVAEIIQIWLKEDKKS